MYEMCTLAAFTQAVLVYTCAYCANTTNKNICGCMKIRHYTAKWYRGPRWIISLEKLSLAPQKRNDSLKAEQGCWLYRINCVLPTLNIRPCDSAYTSQNSEHFVYTYVQSRWLCRHYQSKYEFTLQGNYCLPLYSSQIRQINDLQVAFNNRNLPFNHIQRLLIV